MARSPNQKIKNIDQIKQRDLHAKIALPLILMEHTANTVSATSTYDPS